MSSQAVYARLAIAMKRAVKRTAHESDSEDSVDMVTNRGNKLRKKARYVREGKLAPPSGPEAYKRAIMHAGFERDVISRRPTLYDEDGFEIDSDDDEGVQTALATAAEFYPYSEIRVENLLAPLTRPGDLPDHPTLSRPFTSKPLTDLTRQAREMVQKEQAALWKMKRLMTLMSGDHNWIPCEMLETENDLDFFNDRIIGYQEHLLEKNRLKGNYDLTSFDGKLEEKNIVPTSSALEEGSGERAPPEALGNATPEVPVAEEDVAMIDATNEAHDDKVPEIVANVPAEPAMKTESSETKEAFVSTKIEGADTGRALKSTERAAEGQKAPAADVSEIKINGEADESNLGGTTEESTKPLDETQIPEPDDEEATQEQEDIPEPRRMRTRAQAQAASDNATISRPRSPTPSTNSSYVHPYFLGPPSAHPTPDISLPAVEAAETRRVLSLYIQKQEEICRGSQKIYDGLLRAERLRKTVLKWTKADAHLGEMSDGEDWYDKEEWGLTEDLKKGQDEEEEDAATTAKKTRTRRQ